MSVIPANKSNYYVGIYDNKYNELIDEQFMNKEDILRLCNEYNPYVVGVDTSVIGKYKINKQNLDIVKIL